MGKNLIYGLTDPRTGEIRYIGQSCCGFRRPKKHASAGNLAVDRTYKGNWIRQLQSLNLSYGIVVLAEVDSRENLDAAEIEWIAKGRAMGWPLTNATGGGEGMKKPTPELRAKMSASAKRRFQESPMSKESREKQAAKLRGRPWGKHTPESKLKMRLAKLGRKFTDEHRANMRAAHLGKKRGPYKKKEAAIAVAVPVASSQVILPVTEILTASAPSGASEVLH